MTTTSKENVDALGAAVRPEINFADLEWEKKYSSWRAYGQSKLADLLMGLHLARVSQERG